MRILGMTSIERQPTNLTIKATKILILTTIMKLINRSFIMFFVLILVWRKKILLSWQGKLQKRKNKADWCIDNHQKYKIVYYFIVLRTLFNYSTSKEKWKIINICSYLCLSLIYIRELISFIYALYLVYILN